MKSKEILVKLAVITVIMILIFSVFVTILYNI